jgi:hypothetical protein
VSKCLLIASVPEGSVISFGVISDLVFWSQLTRHTTSRGISVLMNIDGSLI